MSRATLGLAPVVWAAFAGCSNGAVAPAAGSVKAAEAYVLETPPISVGASKERYVCLIKTIEEDLAIDRFDYTAQTAVHHVFFSRLLTNEPEGVSDCNVLFSPTWLPLFVTGSGSTSLEYPTGPAAILRKGTQVVLQLHLLNSGAADVTERVQLVMRRSPLDHADPVAVYAFGTQRIALPPKTKTDIMNDCTPKEDVQVFATLAHMHRHGTSLRLEVAGDDGEYKEVFREDPFSFHRQHIDHTTLRIPRGTKTRITCSYDNSTDNLVGFGESTTDEMCYFVGFIRGKEGAFGCTDGPPDGSGTAPACTPLANAAGIGGQCTKGGGECPAGLTCSLDQTGDGVAASGFCLRIGGCTSGADCGGGGATCCAPVEGGGAINICIPESCRPSTCVVR